jgi:hypothetical protein
MTKKEETPEQRERRLARGKNYYRTHLEQCRERNKKSYAANKEKRAEYKKKYNAEHESQIKAKSKRYHDANVEKLKKKSSDYYAKHKIQAKLKNQQYRIDHQDKILQHQLEIKIGVLAHYGNGKCACVKCGFDNVKALSIDHINGGGNDHRRKDNISGGLEFYRWLIRNNYPKEYQTLCMNCQYIKKVDNREIARGEQILKERLTRKPLP